jgi:hypothetical protein
MKGYFMKKILVAIVLPVLSAAIAHAQDKTDTKANSAAVAITTIGTPSPAITANSTPVELARAALAAQGGDKYKNLKSMILVGSVDLYAPNSTQSIPGKFVMVTAGERVRIEIDARPIMSFKQIFDGQQSYSSIPGVEIPPFSKFGLPVLAKYDQPGYAVSALADKKKLRGFRIVDPDGNTTDFYIDVATGRVMTYLIPFNGHIFGTENSKMKEIEGVLVPVNFTQRLEMQQGAFFAEYKVKDVKLNQPVTDDVFAIQ